MSNSRKPLLALGGLAMLLGALIYTSKFGLAAILLDANFAFAMPIADADAGKVAAVALIGAVAFAAGLVIFAVGYLKHNRPVHPASHERVSQ